MFAITRTIPTSVQVQDAVARVVLSVRRGRNLGGMAVKAADLTSEGQTPDLGALRGEVAQGSSWAAFCMCIEARPLDLGELLELTGVDVMKDVRRLRAFDACVDGYTVFHDGRLRNKL